jgi:hypothetical protein
MASQRRASLTTPANDPIVRTDPPDSTAGWFDRFYFNLHSGIRTPYLLLGGAVYPGAGLTDGYVVAVTDTEQINLRVSDVADRDALPSSVGPLSWETVEPMRTWRLRLEPNPSGLACELTWTARTPAWECEPMVLDDGTGALTFDHAFQSGHYQGWVEIDGTRHEVRNWTGQRDRSRGRRPIRAGLGLHVWLQAQFADESIAIIYNLDRSNKPTLCDGGVLHVDGTVDPIIAVDHELTFTPNLDCGGGRMVLTTEGGRRIDLTIDPTVTRGGYLSGAGYGSMHGKPQGPDHLAHERWDLGDATLTPRHQHYPLDDRLTKFERSENGSTETGAGILEFAHSRHPDYRYQPSATG